MKIKVFGVNCESKELNLNNYSCSLTGLYFESKKDKERFYIKDLSKISINEKGFIMQMVEGIQTMCEIEYMENKRKIELDTYV